MQKLMEYMPLLGSTATIICAFFIGGSFYFLKKSDYEADKIKKTEIREKFEEKIISMVTKTIEDFEARLDKKANTKDLDKLQQSVELQSGQISELTRFSEKLNLKLEMLCDSRADLTAAVKDIKVELCCKIEDLRGELKSSMDEFRLKQEDLQKENTCLQVQMGELKTEVEVMEKHYEN